MTRTMMGTMGQLDSYSVGPRGFTVRIYRRTPGGNFHYEVRSTGERKVIGPPEITDPAKARAWAHRKSEALEQGVADHQAGRTDLALILDTYLANRTPTKRTVGEREADHRRSEMWQRVLGSNARPRSVRLEEWLRFVTDRGEGKICSHGRRAPHEVPEKRKCRGPSPVRARTVQADLLWIRGVLNFAAEWDVPGGGKLLEHPVRGIPVGLSRIAALLDKPAEPRRPVASTDRYEAVMKVVLDALDARAAWKATPEDERESAWPPTTYGYLHELLPIVVLTGRRISSVLQLQRSDVKPKKGPYGTILWRWGKEKNRIEREIPMGPELRAVIDQVLADRGEKLGWLFPGLRTPKKPTHRSVADGWLRKAEAAAKLEPLDGSLWHAYRRAWATARKHLPDADVAYVGGWKNARTLRAVYQQPDPMSIMRVVTDDTELREERG